MGLKAIVQNGIVINVIILEDGADWTPPEGTIIVDSAEGCGIGATWDGNVFTPAPDRPLSTEELRLMEFYNDTDRQNLLNMIKNASPSQIKTYLDNNITNLATAKDILIKTILLIAIIIKR